MRDSFTLYCIEPQASKGTWTFQRIQEGMNGIDPQGHAACWFRHQSANNLFQLPSFWLSVKHIIFKTENGLELHFQPEPKDVGILREYLNDALVWGGIDPLRRLRSKAVWSLVGGLGAVVGYLGALYLFDKVLDFRDEEGRGYGRPLLAAAISGFALAAWGLYTTVRTSRLIRRWKRETRAAIDQDASSGASRPQAAGPTSAPRSRRTGRG